MLRRGVARHKMSQLPDQHRLRRMLPQAGEPCLLHPTAFTRRPRATARHLAPERLETAPRNPTYHDREQDVIEWSYLPTPRQEERHGTPAA